MIDQAGWRVAFKWQVIKPIAYTTLIISGQRNDTTQDGLVCCHHLTLLYYAFHVLCSALLFLRRRPWIVDDFEILKQKFCGAYAHLRQCSATTICGHQIAT